MKLLSRVQSLFNGAVHSIMFVQADLIPRI
jgi:hypothetical protein